ncbi:dihydroorotate dehydrogenase [archaeon]|nr:dihydroorotate dehydrogenase [archaeon]|tara:strand:- start:171 stop:1178 length:1008 start_codon:yes stop_codon:yes gene_type:complete
MSSNASLKDISTVLDFPARGVKFELETPWMITSGILSHPGAFRRYAGCFSAGIGKSIGYDVREGDQTPVTAEVRSGGKFIGLINAVGLSNIGRERAFEELQEIYPKLNEAGIYFFASIFGDTAEEMAAVVEKLDPVCDAFELNDSCPNIKPGESSGISIGKKPELVAVTTRAVRRVTDKPIWIKHTAAVYIYSPSLAMEVALAGQEEGADGHSTINTVPGGMVIDIHARRPILSRDYGGLSGPAVRPIAVGHIYALYETLGPDVPLIGVGGIETAENVVERVEAGASAVAIGTVLRNKDEEGIIEYATGMENDLKGLLEELDVDSLMELRGAAHR